MSDVVKFPGNTTLPSDPATVLEQAKEWGMEHCVIIGMDSEQKLKFGGSTCDAGDILMLLELARKFVVDNHFARTP